ncbi:MAG: phosphotransacetylase [Calditrichaceae bacterium]|nr:phosphotransacetylase [Calditrichaceae bacterium]
MSELIETFKQQCKRKQKRIVFTDALDIRVLEASRQLFDQKLAVPILLGTPSDIRAFAEKQGIHTRGLRIHHPMHMDNLRTMVNDLFFIRQLKGMTRFDAENSLHDPLTMGAMMIRHKQADLCISGNLTNTAKVLQTAIQLVGLKKNHKTVSGYILLISPDDEKVFAFADCSVIPRPTPQQLVDIAIDTAENYSRLTNIEPRAAMLSFSTSQSADHEMTLKVRQAVQLAKQQKPELILDGEVQFDAAIVPKVFRQKAPNCRLEGRANVFVFPSLNAANIGYKIARYLVGYKGVGPVLQGLNGNMQSISIGCCTEDIINLALIASCS